MSKENNVSDKRHRILVAAVKVFSSKGFHEAKVEEIAQIADVGKGTVYEYFSSKAELFQEMFKASMEFYADKLSGQVHLQNSCTDKLKQAAHMHLSFILEHKELAKVTMTEHAHFNNQFKSWMIKTREQRLVAIESIVRAGIENGEFRPGVSPRAVSVTFTGVMGSLFGPAVMGNEPAEKLTILVNEMLDILFNGLVNP